MVIFLFTIYSDYISSSLNPPGQLLSPNEASSAKKKRVTGLHLILLLAKVSLWELPNNPGITKAFGEIF